jgi:hypothetical protein
VKEALGMGGPWANSHKVRAWGHQQGWFGWANLGKQKYRHQSVWQFELNAFCASLIGDWPFMGTGHSWVDWPTINLSLLIGWIMDWGLLANCH